MTRISQSSIVNWDAITIRDSYMFATVFRDPALCRELLQAVLETPIEKVVLADQEKSLVPEPGVKGIRMDVYVADDTGTVYDVEMQNANEGNLAKRSRYYQSANDMDCMAPGMDYEDMRDSFVIFICSFDPFQRGLPRYCITPHCREDGVEMEDGSVRIFVNATAWEKCSDPQLSDFLCYLCGGTIGKGTFTQRVDDAVQFTKQKPDWRRSRMKLERYLEEQRIKAVKEGRAEGRKEERSAIAELASRLTEAGRLSELASALADEQTFERLLEEFDIPLPQEA